MLRHFRKLGSTKSLTLSKKKVLLCLSSGWDKLKSQYSSSLESEKWYRLLAKRPMFSLVMGKTHVLRSCCFLSPESSDSFHYIQMIGNVLNPQATRVKLYIYGEPCQQILRHYGELWEEQKDTQINFDMIYSVFLRQWRQRETFPI